MKFDVEDRVALVTGANRGIGKAIVEALIAHNAKKVYAAVRDIDTAKPLVEKFKDKVVPIQIDLAKPETIKMAAQNAQDVELVINNAGILKTRNPLSHDALEALSEEIEINVYGLIRMAQAFSPILQTNGGGAFVQLNSVASIRSSADIATYSASKACAYSLTEALKEKLADQNTLVISVHPGPIATDMASKAGAHDDAEPPSVVAEGIIQALKEGQFYLFPDSMAKSLWEKYKLFAEQI
jgi:short-subunit dehydrogenase